MRNDQKYDGILPCFASVSIITAKGKGRAKTGLHGVSKHQGAGNPAGALLFWKYYPI
jgi:hypothetical protein